MPVLFPQIHESMNYLTLSAETIVSPVRIIYRPEPHHLTSGENTCISDDNHGKLRPITNFHTRRAILESLERNTSENLSC